MSENYVTTAKGKGEFRWGNELSEAPPEIFELLKKKLNLIKNNFAISTEIFFTLKQKD